MFRPGTVTHEMAQATTAKAVQIANAAVYNLEEPSFANIVELVEDNDFKAVGTPPRLAAQARQIINHGPPN